MLGATDYMTSEVFPTLEALVKHHFKDHIPVPRGKRLPRRGCFDEAVTCNCSLTTLSWPQDCDTSSVRRSEGGPTRVYQCAFQLYYAHADVDGYRSW
jgi:hypothetical protein